MSESISSEAGAASSGATAAIAAGAALTSDSDLAVDGLIKNYVMAASAASLVPLPLLDLAAITGVQMRMIQKLAEHYGKNFSEAPVRNTIASLGGAAVGHGGGIIVGISLAKAIPGVGWMLGIVSMPVLVGASTYAIGHVFAQQFKQGGTVASISAENVREFYNEQLEKGKKVATSLKQEIHDRTATKGQA
jgi:uncharacterized protein (DUF697 family)